MFNFEKFIGDLEDLCRDHDKMTFSQELELKKKLAAHFGNTRDMFYHVKGPEAGIDAILGYIETDGLELYWNTSAKIVRSGIKEIRISDKLAAAVTKLFSDIDVFSE